MDTKFFLGANSPQGFASYYEEWLDLSKMNRVFIIKGTPGNGKSSFMRRVAQKLGEKGYSHESIICSGDGASWDGVLFPELRAAFADGTAPHVIEPQYPLGVEVYLPLTQFIDDAAISRERAAVMRLQTLLREDYAKLTRLQSAIKNLQEEQHALTLSTAAMDTIRRRTRGIIRREIRKGTGGALHKRFLNALAPGGEIVLWDSVDAMADRVYEIQDSYRQAHYMLAPLMSAALEAGQDVYACYDTYSPAMRLRHLLLPGLRLAFVSVSAKEPYPLRQTEEQDKTPYRRIRLDACVPQEILKNNRLRLRFLRKTEAALKDDAIAVLGGIAENHDALEAVYNPHVDFTGLLALADAYAEKLLVDYARGK